MGWQRNDDQYGVSRKVTRIPREQRLAAVGLDQLAKNYSVRAATDGLLDANELREVLATPRLVAALVRVGIWHDNGHSCLKCTEPPRGGIVIHDFLEYNPDAASTNAIRSAKSGGGKHGNHVRWHVSRKVIVLGCEWCESDMRSASDTTSDSEGTSLTNPPGPGPGPITTTDTTHNDPVSPESTANGEQNDQEFIRAEAGKLGIKNLPRITLALRQVLEGDISDAAAIDVTRRILDASTKHVTHVEAYVEKACAESPDEVRGWAA